MALCFGTCENLGRHMTLTKLGCAKQKPMSAYVVNRPRYSASRRKTTRTMPRPRMLILFIILFVNNLMRDLRYTILKVPMKINTADI